MIYRSDSDWYIDNTYKCHNILLLPLPFPLLCGVDVSYETPPSGLALPPLTIFSDKSFLMLSNHLRFGLPLFLSPGTSITITLLPTYSSSHLNTLQPTFLHFLGYFSHLRFPSNSFIPNSLQLGDSNLNILISATSNFFYKCHNIIFVSLCSVKPDQYLNTEDFLDAINETFSNSWK